MRGFVVTSVLAGCSFSPQTASDDASLPTDGMTGPAVCLGLGANFTVCVPTAPETPRTISEQTTLDTDADCTHVLISVSGPNLCVVTATELSITAPLKVIGSRPLVLFATGDLEITSLLDAASHRDGDTGPNAGSMTCVASGPGSPSIDGGGGGAGGSFGTRGGNGGTGNNGATTAGAAALPSAKPTFLRGGCDGAQGGAGGTSATGGLGGKGGGALSLIAGGTLRIAARVDISGAGGTASPRPTVDSGGGGGGGGSGGMLVLFAGTTLDVTGATLIGNGGGGAEGGDKPNNCDPGDDPLVTTSGGAPGAGNCNAGGDGGTGDPSTIRNGVQGGEGGGGGGGGLGVIITAQPLTGALVSPLATPP